VIGALDASVAGPSYRAGVLREAALERLRQLEAEHGEAVAFEILGPPRLSKLLFEVYLLKRGFGTVAAVLDAAPEQLAAALERLVREDAETRQRIISIGIPILLADGERLLRGPVIKSEDRHHGWADLTAANMAKWRERLLAYRATVRSELAGDSSSRHDRVFAASREWSEADGFVDIGEIVGWIFSTEDLGRRAKD
jgi:hypothetical protein